VVGTLPDEVAEADAIAELLLERGPQRRPIVMDYLDRRIVEERDAAGPHAPCQVRVLADRQLLVEGPHEIQHAASEHEPARRRDVRRLLRPEGIVLPRDEVAQVVTERVAALEEQAHVRLVVEVVHALDERRGGWRHHPRRHGALLGVRVEEGDGPAREVALHDPVVVDEREQVSPRGADPSVLRGRRPRVTPADPSHPRVFARESRAEFDGAVAAAVVGDDDLVRRLQVLSAERGGAPLQRAKAVVRRDDDRDAWRCCHLSDSAATGESS